MRTKFESNYKNTFRRTKS